MTATSNVAKEDHGMEKSPEDGAKDHGYNEPGSPSYSRKGVLDSMCPVQLLSHSNPVIVVHLSLEHFLNKEYLLKLSRPCFTTVYWVWVWVCKEVDNSLVTGLWIIRSHNWT